MRNIASWSHVVEVAYPEPGTGRGAGEVIALLPQPGGYESKEQMSSVCPLRLTLLKSRNPVCELGMARMTTRPAL